VGSVFSSDWQPGTQKCCLLADRKSISRYMRTASRYYAPDRLLCSFNACRQHGEWRHHQRCVLPLTASVCVFCQSVYCNHQRINTDRTSFRAATKRPGRFPDVEISTSMSLKCDVIGTMGELCVYTVEGSRLLIIIIIVYFARSST